MFGYGRDLRARTDRQGTFTMTFSHYAPAILNEDDGDRTAGVTEPRRPRTPPLILRASVPEPRE
jgi:translation elongation factor EF-G